MVDSALSQGRQAAGREYAVQPLWDRDQIRAMLAPEGAYAAYALAQLEPGLFELSEWYAASSPEGQALVVHSRSGLGRALFAMGSPEALDAVLKLHPGPRFTFGSLRLEHRPVLQRYFLVTRDTIMLRMSVSRETFRAVDGEAVRLEGRQAGEINRLYSAEGGPTSYSARNIDEGTYYGIRLDGRLVSIAGTHVVSPGEGVAVVGNVFTHPLYRNRGLATIVSCAVTRELLRACSLVALTVEAENAPAVRAYRRLGYKPECSLYETPLIRKEPLGIISLARRLAAGWRGRADGKEIVVK